MPTTMNAHDLSEMVRGYLSAALFTADESLIPPSPGEFPASKYLPRCSKAMRADAEAVCSRFLSENAEDLADYPPFTAGSDLWYTRNGHGVGFWEADHCTKEQAKRLSLKARSLRQRHVYRNRGGWFDYE